MTYGYQFKDNIYWTCDDIEDVEREHPEKLEWKVSKFFHITEKTYHVCKEMKKTTQKDKYDRYFSLLKDLENYRIREITYRQFDYLSHVKTILEPEDYKNNYCVKNSTPCSSMRKLTVEKLEELLSKNENKDIFKITKNDSAQKVEKKYFPTKKPINILNNQPIQINRYMRSSVEEQVDAKALRKADFGPVSEKTPDVDSPEIQKLRDEIGLWGERKVFVSLIQRLKSRFPDCRYEEHDKTFRVYRKDLLVAEFEWLNSEQTVQQGYDMILKYDSDEDKFIEVKSTSSNQYRTFEIFGSQWKLMREKGPNYIIYLVINSGSQSATIMEIENPYKLIFEGSIGVDGISISI